MDYYMTYYIELDVPPTPRTPSAQVELFQPP
jgi:hypothetical protein